MTDIGTLPVDPAEPLRDRTSPGTLGNGVLAARPPLTERLSRFSSHGSVEVALAGDLVLALEHAAVALTGSAVGLLLGAVLVGRARGWLTPGRLPAAVSSVVAAGVVLLVAAPGPWRVCGCLLLTGLTVSGLRVLIDVLILRRVGAGRSGLAAVAVVTVLRAGPLLGVLAAGLLLQFADDPLGTVLALTVVQVSVTLHSLGHRVSRTPAGAE